MNDTTIRDDEDILNEHQVKSITDKFEKARAINRKIKPYLHVIGIIIFAPLIYLNFYLLAFICFMILMPDIEDIIDYFKSELKI